MSSFVENLFNSIVSYFNSTRIAKTVILLLALKWLKGYFTYRIYEGEIPRGKFLPSGRVNPKEKGMHDYDVIVIGTGPGGSVPALILAKMGAKVLMLDSADHPRFVVGESLNGETNLWMRLMAARFDIPELFQASTYLGLRKHLGDGALGLKRGFGWQWHKFGEKAKWEHATQASSAVWGGFGPDAHVFRADYDLFLFQTAIKYGADFMTRAESARCDFGPNQAVVHLKNGQSISCSYVIDAAGYNSVVCNQYKLRDEVPRARVHSRVIFSHFIDLVTFDDAEPSTTFGLHSSWWGATVHHVFEGGWMWMIPFNNHESTFFRAHENSPNRATSVGLLLDPRVWPLDNSLTPEQEFDKMLELMPSIKKQFVNAKRVRPWVRTERLQYTTKTVVGNRWCLAGHSAGFVDPLYSRGLIINSEATNSICTLVLNALEDGDFSAHRFALYEDLLQGLIQDADLTVWMSYVSFRDPFLWRSVMKWWFFTTLYGALRKGKYMIQYWEQRDRDLIDNIDTNLPEIGVCAPELKGFTALRDQVLYQIEQFDRDDITAQQASDAILRLMANSPFSPPSQKLGDPEHRVININSPFFFPLIFIWANTVAPETVQKHFNYHLITYMRTVIPFWLGPEPGQVF